MSENHVKYFNMKLKVHFLYDKISDQKKIK